MDMRNHLLDNAKALLIFLVILGHMVEPFIENIALFRVIYLVIYSFHIPMFAFISGMLSTTNLSRDSLEKNIRHILVPFFVFELLYELLHLMGVGHVSSYTLGFEPYWLLWFLLSLFAWKIMLPIVSATRYPVLFSIGIALVLGYCESIGYFLGISRTATFFPFFVLGYYSTPRFFEKAKKRINKICFIGTIIAAVAIIIRFNSFPHSWLWGSLSYPALGQHEWHAALIRLSLYVFSFCLGVSVISLLPKRELNLTVIGQRSLCIYLWHGFFIKLIIRSAAINSLLDANAYLTLLAVLFLSLALTLFLSLRIITTMTDQVLSNRLLEAFFQKSH
jgi:fucose 4-O-acetylase-like acetyltransferase